MQCWLEVDGFSEAKQGPSWWVELTRKGPSPHPPFLGPPPGSSLQLLQIEPAAPSLCSPLLWRADWVGSPEDPSLGEEVHFLDSDKIPPRRGRVSLVPGPHGTLGRPVSGWGRLVPEGHSSEPGVSEGAPGPPGTLQRAPCLGGHTWSPRDTPARPVSQRVYPLNS